MKKEIQPDDIWNEHNSNKIHQFIQQHQKQSHMKTTIITSGLTFGQAIEDLKQGHPIARKGWENSYMTIFKGLFNQTSTSSPESTYGINHSLFNFSKDTPGYFPPTFSYHGRVESITPQDILAEDWCRVFVVIEDDKSHIEDFSQTLTGSEIITDIPQEFAPIGAPEETLTTEQIQVKIDQAIDLANEIVQDLDEAITHMDTFSKHTQEENPSTDIETQKKTAAKANIPTRTKIVHTPKGPLVEKPAKKSSNKKK